jgi:hypothetical protein
LEKQDVLRVLERRLDQYGQEHITTSFTRDLSADDLMPRQPLLEEIEHAFNSYGESDPKLTEATKPEAQVLIQVEAAIRQSSQQLLAISRPTDPEFRAVQT